MCHPHKQQIHMKKECNKPWLRTSLIQKDTFICQEKIGGFSKGRNCELEVTVSVAICFTYCMLIYFETDSTHCPGMLLVLCTSICLKTDSTLLQHLPSHISGKPLAHTVLTPCIFVLFSFIDSQKDLLKGHRKTIENHLVPNLPWTGAASTKQVFYCPIEPGFEHSQR